MQETALNVPFDSQEICDILVDEFRSRLRGLSPLQGGKQYAAFSAEFQVKIRLRRSGEQPQEGRETLAWGGATKPSAVILTSGAEGIETVDETSKFESGDPNEERLERDMPLSVETGDGRGGRIIKKVKIKAEPKKKQAKQLQEA